MNTRNIVPITLISFLLCTNSGCNKKSADKPVEVAKVAAPASVATVNGQAISQHQLDRIIIAITKQKELSGEKATEADSKEIKRGALKRLVDMELLYQEALAKKITVPAEEIDKSIKQIKSQFPDEKAFQQAYKEINSSEAELHEDVKKNLCINNLVKQEILSKIEINEKDAQDLYNSRKEIFKRPETVQISHILIKLPNTASVEDEKKARKKIDDIKKRLDKGEDFAKLAKENSECPSAEKGGNLGFIARGQMVAEFEESAFKLAKTGELSPVTRTSYGFHLLKRGEKHPETAVAFEEAKADIINYLKKSKVNEAMPKYIESLYAKATIKSDIDFQKPKGNIDPKTAEKKPVS